MDAHIPEDIEAEIGKKRIRLEIPMDPKLGIIKWTDWIRKNPMEPKWFHQQGERVQTSNIANAPMSAAMNVDDMLERMNEEVVEEVSKGYDQICERIMLVNAALAAMPVEVQHVAKQVYGRGVRKSEVIGVDGHIMGRTKVYELLQIAESIMAHSIQEDRSLRNLTRTDE